MFFFYFLVLHRLSVFCSLWSFFSVVLAGPQAHQPPGDQGARPGGRPPVVQPLGLFVGRAAAAAAPGLCQRPAGHAQLRLAPVAKRLQGQGGRRAEGEEGQVQGGQAAEEVMISLGKKYNFVALRSLHFASGSRKMDFCDFPTFFEKKYTFFFFCF